jgi:transposase
MQTLVERGCGLDVHQATVVACLLIVGKDGKVQKQMRTFGTTTRELLNLREWLLSQGCTHAAMGARESIGNPFTPSWREGCRSWWPTRNRSRKFLGARPT